VDKKVILRFESHIHTNFSDGNFYKLMIRAAIKKRIDILAITDHNTMKGYEYCVRYAKECSKRNLGDIFILQAEEVECKEGDILAYGITEQIKKGILLHEAIDNIHEQGGLAVVAHPFNISTSVSAVNIDKNTFDGIEIINFHCLDITNILAKRFATSRPSLFRIGGNDAHQPWAIGIVLNIIEAEPETDSILKSLKNKKIRVFQSPKSFPWRVHFFFKYYVGDLLTILRTNLLKNYSNEILKMNTCENQS